MARCRKFGWVSRPDAAATAVWLTLIASLVVTAPRAAAQERGADPYAAAPQVQASAAILVDLATGTVLYEKNAHARRPNASTTKILTAVMILESGRLDEDVVLSRAALATDYANLNGRLGERIPLGDLLYPIMLRSSNDACVAAAEHLYGSERAMAEAMNRKALELGLRNTHFVTVSGLYHPQHYSSAADLAQMTRYAAQIPLFNEIVACRQKSIRRSLNKADRLITNRNKFLDAYPGADGVKTGYVRQSGRCLVASATRMEKNYPWRLIAVVLNSPDPIAECRALLDYGFTYFEPVFLARAGEAIGRARVSGGTRASVPIVAPRDLWAVVPRGREALRPHLVATAPTLAAPVRLGARVGQIAAVLDGRSLCTWEATAGVAVARFDLFAAAWPWMLALVGVLLGPRYARALAKSARRRRRRVATTRGGADPRRSSDGRWPGDPRTGGARRPGLGPDYGRWATDRDPRPPTLPRAE